MDAKDNTDTLIYRSSRPEVFCKGGVLEKFAKLTGKHLWPATLYQKRDSGTGVFLWVLQIFSEHLFLQNTSVGCFLIDFFHDYAKQSNNLSGPNLDVNDLKNRAIRITVTERQTDTGLDNF